MKNLAWFKKGEFWVTKTIEDQPSFSWGNGLTKKSKDFRRKQAVAGTTRSRVAPANAGVAFRS